MASHKKKASAATATKARPKASARQSSKAPPKAPSKVTAKVALKSAPKAIAKAPAKVAHKVTIKDAPPVAVQAKESENGLRTAKGVLVKDKPWGKKELAYFEKRLMEERKRVMKQLAQWDESMRSTIQNADGDLSAYSFHMADQGTDAMEREKAFLFASKEGRYLWHIDQALRRMYKSPELFGICEVTGERIEYERLDALPHARLSYKAKRQEEGDNDIE